MTEKKRSSTPLPTPPDRSGEIIAQTMRPSSSEALERTTSPLTKAVQALKEEPLFEHHGTSSQAFEQMIDATPHSQLSGKLSGLRQEEAGMQRRVSMIQDPLSKKERSPGRSLMIRKNLMIGPVEWDAVAASAEREGLPYSAIIRRAIRAYFGIKEYRD